MTHYSVILFYNILRGSGVVNFISKREPVNVAAPLVRPQASTPPRKNLSPLVEEVEPGNGSPSQSPVGVPKNDTDGRPELPVAIEDADAIGSQVPTTTGDEGGRLVTTDPGYAAEDEDNSEYEDTAHADEQDDELSSIMDAIEALNDITDRLQESDVVDDGDSVSERHIGVTQDRDDHHVTIPKAKRVLSFNTLAALNSEVSCIRTTSPKRQKSVVTLELSRNGDALFGGFSLGPPAIPDSFGDGSASDLLMGKKILQFRKPQESPVMSSSDDDEAVALDRQLEAELYGRQDPKPRQWQREDGPISETDSPVPLLTPPQSPLTVEIHGNKATVCEWPSNLAVDSAMAFNEVKSATLEELLEKDSECRAPTTRQIGASTLTPMLVGISVTGV